MSTTSNPPVFQRALTQGPGRFRSALTFNARKPKKLLVHLETLAALLKEIAAPDLANKPLRILVGVAPGLLHNHPDWPKLEREYVNVEGTSSTADVFVQVAAETEDERIFALRLVKRVLDADFELFEQTHGVERSLSKEPFGYRHEAPWAQGEGAVPLSGEVPGASWLLYLPCVQDLAAFFAQALHAQDAIIGRGRDAPIGTAGSPGSHVALARDAQAGDASRLLRRSFSYECYEEAGMVFIASAAHAQFLADARRVLHQDPLLKFIQPGAGGLFVLPPSAEWLMAGTNVEPRAAQERSLVEQVVFPTHPIVLYEMTPLTRDFFLRCFHKNKDNFETDGHLREDLATLAKGLAKMVYGGHLSPDSRFKQFLELAFRWDNSEPFRSGQDLLVEKVNKLRKDGVSPERLAAARAELRANLATQQNCELASEGLGQLTVAELMGDIIRDDAEFSAMYSEEHQRDFETLFILCEAAAAEGQALNDAAGTYMSIVC